MAEINPKTVKIVGVVALLLILLLMYSTYNCYTGGSLTQRVWPRPTIKPFKEYMSFVADAVIPRDDVFFTKMSDKLPSIFKSKKEREKARQEAITFFKQQFGVSDTFLNAFMSELTVNEKVGYRANYVSSSGGKQYKVVDGGFAVYVPVGKKLYGRYGGKDGVSSDRSGILAYGYYILGNDYLLRYYGKCPLTTLSTYDGDYTFIDCDVDVVKSLNKKTIGMSGKAQGAGIYKNTKDSAHVVFRNVITV